MEITDLYTIPSSPSFFHMLESEEDFPFGAKTTSFLPPATVTNAATTTTTTTTTAATTATYDLPEWMEGREILGLPNMFHTPLSLPGSTAQGGSLFSLDEDDFCTTIKPEDMLVPLSELQPPHTPASPPLSLTPPATPPRVLTPPATPPLVPTPPVSPPLVPTPHAILPLIPTPHATLPLVPTVPVSPVSRVPAKPPIPKVIICRKITTSSPKTKPIQVNFQVMPVKQVAQVTPAAPLLLHTTPHAPNLQTKQSYEGQVAVMPHGGSYGEHQVNTMALALPQNVSSVQAPQTCDAEELINEMVQMIGSSSSSSSGGFRGLENVSFDASAMEASMEDLLSQLEASEPQPNASFSLPSQDSTAVSVAAPHPSESHHPSSPASISVSLPAESPSSSVTSPHPSGSLSIASPAYLPSPVPSVGTLSPAPSTSESLFCASADPVEMECLEEEWSPLEETHSYSRSQRKTKSSRRKSGARKTPYLEDRKERKKEQNKQAALRYRQKKKQEEDDLTGKIEIEEERQQKLKLKYSGIKQELSYLKKIMREVFMARGLLSEEALKKAALEKKSH